jgi:transcriptional regulator with XRE-family HTH domain
MPLPRFGPRDAGAAVELLVHRLVHPLLPGGEQLGLLRTAAGYASHEALAKALLTDRSTVTKIETGARPPNDKLLALWLDVCGVAGQLRTVLEGLGVLARAKEDSALLKVAPWFETEAKAHTLRYWAPVIVPGLVQTETYARELSAAMAFDDAKATEFLEVRMGRQATGHAHGGDAEMEQLTSGWRKSSHSGNGGANCVETSNVPT